MTTISEAEQKRLKLYYRDFVLGLAYPDGLPILTDESRDWLSYQLVGAELTGWNKACGAMRDQGPNPLPAIIQLD